MEEFKNEKLNRFVATVNIEIDEKIAEILSDAEKTRSEIIEEANAKSTETADKYYSENIKKIVDKYNREASKKELEAKKVVLMHRESLTDKVFEQVGKRLLEFKKTPEYISYLNKLIAEANLFDGDIIYISVDDLPLNDKLSAVDGVDFASDEQIKLGGLSFFHKASGTISDKTFDATLREERKNFAGNNRFAD